MNKEQFIYTPFTEKDEVKNNNFGKIVSKYFYHWPLFLICILVTIALAVLYIRFTNSVYHVKAKISINDNKNKDVKEKDAALEQLNLSTGSKLVESEVEIIKSRPLIRDVVQDLQLWATYKQTVDYKTSDIYAKRPFKVQLINGNKISDDYNFKVVIVDQNNFRILNEDGEKVGKFSMPISGEFGNIKLVPTSNLNKYLGKTIKVELSPEEDVVTDYQEKITATFNKLAPMVELNLEDEVPLRGIQILNRLVVVYKNSNILDKNKETLSTLKFIDERLGSLSTELMEAEKTVEGYKSSIGLTDISSKSQYFLNNIQSNDGRLGEVNVQLNVIRGIENYVNSAKGTDNPPATIGIADPNLVSLVSRLSTLMLERDQMLATAPENNPIFYTVNSEIKSVKGAIKESIKNIKTSLINTNRELNKISSGYEGSIRDIPGQERKYVSIKRQRDNKESLYVYLLQKREEVALSYASTLRDARIVENAYVGKPDSKKKGPLTLALLAGLILPITLITSRDALRNRILTIKDIENGTSAPVIAELIQEPQKNELVMLNKGAYAITEQIRNLRTNILQQSETGKGQVILMSSSVAGEGKSFVASNLALSLASTGKKTIMLELDLRKPRLSKLFQAPENQLGVSNYLQGEVAKEDIIFQSELNPNLYLMGSGPIPDNPSELLEGSYIEKLIDELRLEFDQIIIDSPPMHLVTDGLILAPFCDICLYLIRHNHTSKSELRFIEELHSANKVSNLFLVFNGVFMDNRYGYSVDYGYYAEESQSKPAFSNFSLRF